MKSGEDESTVHVHEWSLADQSGARCEWRCSGCTTRRTTYGLGAGPVFGGPAKTMLRIEAPATGPVTIRKWVVIDDEARDG